MMFLEPLPLNAFARALGHEMCVLRAQSIYLLECATDEYAMLGYVGWYVDLNFFYGMSIMRIYPSQTNKTECRAL
jgi:hypothetical protein